MGYVWRAPAPALAPFVDALWWFDGELAAGRERIMPSGTMQLLVNLHDDELRAYEGDASSAWCGRAAIVAWARVASDCGYFDQMHLDPRFRAFSGIAPSAYAEKLSNEEIQRRVDPYEPPKT